MARFRPHTKARKPHRPRYAGLFRIPHLYALVSLAVLAVVLAIWGAVFACDQCKTEHIWDIGHKLPRLLSVLPGLSQKGSSGSSAGSGTPELTYAQYVLSVLVLYGTLRVFTINLRRDIRVWLARLRRNHVIVCGLGETGREAADNLHYDREYNGIVAIALDNDEPNAVVLDQLKVPILKGDATQFGMLGLAGLRHARGVLVTTGSDAINIEVALRVADELVAVNEGWWPRFWGWVHQRSGKKKEPIFVLPEVRSAWLLELLHNHPTTTLGSEGIDTRPFDLYASAARQLLGQPPFRRRLPPGMRPHLLLAGLGEMGTQIILQAVCVSYAVPDCRLAVTVLDQQGEDAVAGLAARFPGLRDLVDLDFIKTTFSADNTASWNEAWINVDEVLSRPNGKLFTVAVIVSLTEDKDSLHTALQLRQRLDRLRRFGTPVFARVRRQRALGEFATRLDGPNTLVDRLIPFGDLARLTATDQLVGEAQDQFARALHEAYLARNPTNRGAADVPWEKLPERFKQSNRGSADHLPAKLRLVGMRTVAGAGEPARFEDDELDLMAVAEHERWLIEHKAFGWTLGPRDDIKLVHPDMKPWYELSDETREYDCIMVRASRAKLATINQTIRRERFIVAVGKRLPAAEAALAKLHRAEVAIVVFDPNEPASWNFACRAVERLGEERRAVLWVLWHEDRVKPPVAPPDVSVPSEVRKAVEAVISNRELEAMGL